MLKVLIFGLLFSFSAKAQFSLLNVDVAKSHQSPMNLILNPFCDKNVVNITASSVVPTKNTSQALNGFTDCAWNPTATGQKLTWAMKTLPSGISGANCEAEINFRNDASLVKAYINSGLVSYPSGGLPLVVSSVNGSFASIGYICAPGQTLTVETTGDPGPSNYSVYAGLAKSPSNVSYVSLNQVKAPTVQKFTSSSGTYTTPAGVTHIRVKMVGGGAGGGGGGTTDNVAPTAGGNSTFGSSLLTANGGAAGTMAGATPAGGSATISSPAVGTALAGGGGDNASQSVNASGGGGGSTCLGGGGGGGLAASAATAVAAANTGGGGGGAGSPPTGTVYSGVGGGGGGCIDAIIFPVSASYPYAVGAAGSGGSANGTGNRSGAAGSAGYIEVTEYYGFNVPVFIGSVTSNSTTAIRHEAAIFGTTSTTVCSASPCAYLEQFNSSWLTNVTRTSTGIYVLNFPAGTWASTPVCTCTGAGVAGPYICRANTSTGSSSSVTLRMTSDSGGLFDEMVNVHCTGTR